MFSIYSVFILRLIGLLLREKCVHNPNTGSHWTTSLLFSLLQELVPLYDVEKDDLNGMQSQTYFSRNPMSLTVILVEKATERIELYNKFVTRVEELELPASLDAKSLLDVSSSLFLSYSNYTH